VNIRIESSLVLDIVLDTRIGGFSFGAPSKSSRIRSQLCVPVSLGGGVISCRFKS
jgi:hypothetical protein